jgi:hypothetical protein
MTGIVGAFRSGAWLTKRRMRDYSIILLAYYVLIFAFIFLTAHGDLDTANRPIGTDFSQVWVAGRSVLAGHPESPFSAVTHAAAMERAFGHGTPFYGWHYPPYFLMIATVLALLPYLPALIVWQGSTLALYGFAMTRIVRRPPALLCALAFPAVYVNLGHGHNGFLTAALLSFGCLWLGRRDWLAGVMFGLVAYKPQFGLVVPVALLASGAWRSILAGAATVAAMTAATIAWFGFGVWQAFVDNLAFTRQVVLEEGNTGWAKIQSVFSAVRMQGGSVGLAYGAQSVVSLAVLGLIGWLWYSPADRRLKAAALLPAALLTTPYCLDYDMMLLGPAIAFIAAVILERGARNWEMTALAAVWISPLVARVGGDALHLPIGLAAILGLFGMAVSRGLRPVRKEGLLF